MPLTRVSRRIVSKPDVLQRHRVPRPALYLGAGGLIPFVVMAAALVIAPRDDVLFALGAYGAVILSFLGGIRWGLAIRGGDSGHNDAALGRWLAISVSPSLAGWAALLLPAGAGLLLLAVAFALMLALDVRAARANLAPAWYPRLRVPLTAVVVACLLAGWAAR